MIQVLIADDQAVVRAGFRMILEQEPDIAVVAEARNGCEAVTYTRQLRPDVVIMDIRMPEMDGLEATRQVAGPSVADPVRVLVVTTFDLDEYVFGALAVGAAGFVVKDITASQLIDAVRAVASGDAVVSPRATRRLLEEFATGRPSSPGSPPVANLTTREYDTFLAVARGLSNAQIAREQHLSEATVKTYVSRILAKLGLRSRVQAVVLAYETGIVEPRRKPALPMSAGSD